MNPLKKFKTTFNIFDDKMSQGIISNLHPYCQFDPNKLWNDLVELFKTSVQNCDTQNISNSLNQLKYYITVAEMHLNPTNNIIENMRVKRKRCAMILGPLFDFVTTIPFFDLSLQLLAAKIFCIITVNYLTEASLCDAHLSLDKALKFYKELFYQPPRLKTNLLSSQMLKEFLLFFSAAAYYFDESDADILLDKFLDKFGYIESNSILCTLQLLLLYPTRGNSFDKIIVHLNSLLENTISNNFSSAIFKYFSKVYSSSIRPYFDWKPFLRPIFNSISNASNPYVEILGKKYNLSDFGNELTSDICLFFNQVFIPLHASVFIPYLLIEHDEEKNEEQTNCSMTLSLLKDFVNAFIPIITPHSIKAQKAVLFISNLIIQFNDIVVKMSIRKKNNLESVKNMHISDETIEKFVEIVLPFVESSLFNSKPIIQYQILDNIAKLAGLSYDLTVKSLLPFCLENMIDSEMTSTSQICFNVIDQLIPIMMIENHYEENLQFIPQIISACLERCKNFDLDNFYLGMSVLSEIAQYISIPPEEDINTKLSMKQRITANAMINSLNAVIICHFEHNKILSTETNENVLTGSPVASTELEEAEAPKEAEKGPLDKQFISYFAAFDDSYIESIVIPSIIEHFKNTSETMHSSPFTSEFLRYLSRAKPDLITNVLSPKFEKFFTSSKQERKLFWCQLLASTFISCPSFSEKIPHYVEIIKELLAIKDDIDEEESKLNLKCAHELTSKLLGIIPGIYIIDWSNNEANEDKIKWGKVYHKYEVHPKWYRIDQSIINSTADSIFKSLEPYLADFQSFTLKKQKKIIKIIDSFIALINFRGKFGLLDFYDYSDNETLANIEKLIFKFIDKMIPALQSYQNAEALLSLLNDTLGGYIDSFSHISSDYMSICSKYQNIIDGRLYIGSKSSRFYSLVKYYYEVTSSLYNYTYQITPNVELILDKIFDLLTSEFESIRNYATQILSYFIQKSKRIDEEYLLRMLTVLEDPNKTEHQCKSAMLYIIQFNITTLQERTDLLIRFFKALISLKYEKEWEISEQLSFVLILVNSLHFLFQIEESKIWRDFENEVVNLPMTIDPLYFIIIIKFIVFQNPAPSVSIVRYLLKTMKDASDTYSPAALICLCNILYRIKPIAPRSTFKSIKDFKGEDGLLPYIDKLSTGCYCKPHQYVLYTGPSVYNEEDENVKKYSEVRHFLINDVFNNEEIFSEFYERFALLHSSDEYITFNINIFYVWKGIGQIIRSNIVKYTKGFLLDILNDDKKINELSQAHLISVCEIVAGISRATKHWTSDEKKVAIEELLIPATKSLILQKGNDPNVQEMISVIIKDWDCRRVSWLYTIIEELLSNIKENKEQLNIIAFRSVMNVASKAYILANQFINEQFLHVIKDIVIPLFSDLKKYTNDDISNFELLLFCRFAILPKYQTEKLDTPNEIAKIAFNDVFDKHKEESPELVALFLFGVLLNNFAESRLLLPYIAERFKDICLIENKLAGIASGKYLDIGQTILCICGFIQWSQYKEKKEAALFDDVIKGQILPLKESLLLNTRLNLVGFLHALTFSNLFLFTKKEFSWLIDDVLPFFLSDSNSEVRLASNSLLKIIVCIAYSDRQKLCSEKVENLFDNASKILEKEEAKKALFVAVSFACALIANVSISLSSCPDWLPHIFDLLERTYDRGICKEEIKKEVGEFFKKHEGKKIAEIEAYKYISTISYLA